jgi:eukaryotic-like serine/threonine-protein kinase
MYTLPSERVRSGAFEFDLSTGELRSIEARDPNSKALLREQVVQVLRMLVEREGKIVTREEIKSRLWGDDTVIDFDQRINVTIKALRRALGDSADNPRYIETMARHGYRLMLTIEYLASAPGTAPAEVTVEAPRTRGRWRGALATGALLAAGALGVWRYEVYRHRISLSSTNTIVLADVDNRTSDPVLDGALNTALRYELEQTPYLNLLGLDKTYATMGQMKLVPTIKITPEVARQICSKTNSKMVIADSIADAGNRYHLEIGALDCSAGATLVEEGTDISARNQVVHELETTAVRLRRKLGEPAESLARFNQPLEKALSPSLEALESGSSAIPDSKKEGALRKRCRQRPVQYLNNILEQDHRAIKRRVNAKQGFREFQGARRMIQDHEAVHMIRKGQVRWVAGDNLLRQIQFIDRFFDLAT